MMKEKVILFLGLLILYSCNSQHQESNKEIIQIPENRLCKIAKNKDLIRFHFDYLRDYNELEFNNPSIAKTKIIKKQILDTLKVNIELPFSGCAEIDGDFKIKGDSLILYYWLRYDEVCTELSYYNLEYYISNKSNIKYKVHLKRL